MANKEKRTFYNKKLIPFSSIAFDNKADDFEINLL